MKRKLIAFICSVMMLFGFSATASAAANDLGYVNWVAIVSNYPGIQDVAQDINKEKNKLQAQFNEQAKDLDDKAKIELANKLNADMAKYEQKLYAPINQEIRATILEVAKKHYIKNVVNAAAIVVGGVDLTQEVIEALKK